MIARIAAFECRYQLRGALALSVAALLFAGAFVDMSVAKLMSSGGGHVLYNAPHAIVMTHVVASLLFLFVGAAFVCDAILRDTQTGFAAIVRSTAVCPRDLFIGRFSGAFAAGALVLAAVPLGAWLGTLMPFADQAMLGPNRLSGFAYGYGLVALPNAFIIAAFLFALSAATRSTAGTFVGVAGFLFVYLASQRLMENVPQLSAWRTLADPLGLSAYLASARYLTASELNAGLVPISRLWIASRLLWVAFGLAALAAAWLSFRRADGAPTARPQPGADAQASLPPAPSPSPQPGGRAKRDFGRRTTIAQFAACARLEMRFVVRSPLFLILLVIAFAASCATLLTATGWNGVPAYPRTATAVPLLQQLFGTLLILVAIHYGGELVWRDRECSMDAIVDSAPVPSSAMMLAKLAGLAVVMTACLAIGMLAGLLVQWIHGATAAEPGKYLRWYLLPGAVDAVLVAALSVFIHASSPGKYAGWGLMAIYVVLLIFGSAMGLEYPLFLYGRVAGGPLFDMAGSGNWAIADWWFRLFWAAIAACLLVAAYLLWPRGADRSLARRLRHAPRRLNRSAALTGLAALVTAASAGAWIIYNTRFLNAFMSATAAEASMAAYEARYLRYAGLPQPTVRHVDLEIALYPDERRADVAGRYRLVNETRGPIRDVHVRLLGSGLQFVDVDFPGARLAQDDERRLYRIYRLERAMRPGEARWLGFRTRRQQPGFRAAGADLQLVSNGTNLTSLDLVPRIGMSDAGLIADPAVRRRYGLPARLPLPRLEDRWAAMATPNGDLSWATSDIIVSTAAGQMPLAPGRRVSDSVEHGRRVVRFVSDQPIKNFISVQSGRYAVRRGAGGGVNLAVYYHPAHRWNVERMLKAMRASLDYYRSAFGPYPLGELTIVERPAEGGGQAFPGMVAIGEDIFALDVSDPQVLDMVTMLTAHEIAHQWWGQQVQGARMQGGAMLHESLAQYSALMVLKRLRGRADVRQFLQFQIDRYLSGRRTAVAAEQPLVRAGLDDDHVNYGKGAIAFYLLQERMGEAAVNRALRRFAARYRFAGPPYPSSTDLVAMLRDEAKTPELRMLISDLLERITLYDFAVDGPSAVRRADGRWDISVPVDARKVHSDPLGHERPAPLGERVPIGLFATNPATPGLRPADIIATVVRPLHSGRQVVRFVTDRPPAFAAVDPYAWYIDRDTSTNVAPVSIEARH